jgi:ring-1,2-phenylacetyl-CoA epoxidase subunit PaaD
MVTAETVLDVLRTINDPEMPINIVDLGIVEAVRIAQPEPGPGPVTVAIDILPTFVGCPALPVIEEEIRKRVTPLQGVGAIQVNFKFDPPWTVDRISLQGRESLRASGVTVPRRGGGESASDSVPTCPFCGSSDVHLESAFGPTRCRMIYHCASCRHPFEHLKRVSLATISAIDKPAPC